VPIPIKRAKPALCRSCGHPLTFRPWFRDRNGVIHYARTYGKRVFVWCEVCSRGGPFGGKRSTAPRRRPPAAGAGAAVRKPRVSASKLRARPKPRT
jgi:hypothetical protein